MPAAAAIAAAARARALAPLRGVRALAGPG